MQAVKLLTAKLTCEVCGEVSYLDIRSINGDHCCYILCFHCNQLYYSYNDARANEITITLLQIDEAVNVFKQQEKYKDHAIPLVIRKTKTIEQYINGL